MEGRDDEARRRHETPWGRVEGRKGMTRGEDPDFSLKMGTEFVWMELQLLGVAAFRPR